MTIETEEKTVLRGSQGRRPTLTWCPACRREVEMVTPERAAQIAGVSTPTIYRWIEARTAHFIEDCDRSTLVCLGSLEQSASSGEWMF